MNHDVKVEPKDGPFPEEFDGGFCNIEMPELIDLEEGISHVRPNSAGAKDLDKIRFVRFYVPSFLNLYGQWVVEGKTQRRARTRFQIRGWLLTIDRLPDADESNQSIRQGKGHYVTHKGVIQRADGTVFGRTDLNDCLDLLYWLFTFACASRRGITDWQSFNEFGEFLEGRHEGLQLGPAKTFSWFPEGFENPFDGMADSFAAKFNDPFWGDVLLFVIHVLAEANLEDLSSESKMVLGQTALETLCSSILVETMGRSYPGNDKAARMIRDLIQHVGASGEIATHLTHLKALAVTEGWSDGPESIVRLRNMLVHPERSKRRRWLAMDDEAKFQATLLSLHYAELVILWLVGYDGPFVDRTNLPMMLGKHEPSPWPSGGTRP